MKLFDDYKMVWSLEWWGYSLIVLSMFFVCLLLNYIVKKINESHLEARLIRLQQKTPASLSTQVQGPLIEMETKLPDISRSIVKAAPATPQIKEVNRINNEKTKPVEITLKAHSAIYNSEKLDTSRNDQFDASKNKESLTLGTNNQNCDNVTLSANESK